MGLFFTSIHVLFLVVKEEKEFGELSGKEQEIA